MAIHCPPITLALPGVVQTDVIPPLTASVKFLSIGFIPSIGFKWGVTGSVCSLPSAPSAPIPSSQRPKCVWASIKPGSTKHPFASITVASKGATISLPISIIFLFSIRILLFIIPFVTVFTVPFYEYHWFPSIIKFS